MDKHKEALEDYIKTKPRTQIAEKLLRQIEEENSVCAFWVVSAIDKITKENPKMSIICLRNIINANMPKALVEYCEYLRHT